MSEQKYQVQKTILFNGRRYFRKENGYYYNSSTRKHLHQAIWIAENGPIPDGYVIHHIDHDKDNNDISNLACITAEEHRRIHKEEMPDELREWYRNNLNENARPKAIEWHKSEAGRDWHKEHIRKQHESGVFKHELKCSNCGKEYVGEINKKDGNHFCCNNCRAQFLRHKRSSDKSDKRICIICGKEYMTSPWSSSKTCSRSCANVLKWRNHKGEQNGFLG